LAVVPADAIRSFEFFGKFRKLHLRVVQSFCRLHGV